MFTRNVRLYTQSVENVKKVLKKRGPTYVQDVKIWLDAVFGISLKKIILKNIPKILSQKPIKGLMIWCQVCSHSGHVREISEWFKKNKECPMGCGHKCFEYYKQINMF